ncbi:MAG: LLM class flavin-dependent oxidoreductase [Chloroflexia bacterium]|nr:LLM class flavin-dependent oxidoreductase [Chloroflexia bacterium]
MDTPRHRPLKVGLHLQMFENLRTRVLPSWSDLLAITHHAEAVGFDSIWLADHLFVRFPPDEVYEVWEGWSMLSAVAATTSRMEIGTLVTCTSFRNPALLAKMAVTVDEISGGRLILGLGAGWHEPDFRAFGFPFDHRVGRFEEALIITTTLLREGKIDFEGQYYQSRECELRPRGPRPQGPPIVVGAAGERMLRLTARHADAWNRDSNPAGSIAELPDWRAKVDAACAAEGRDPSTLARYAAVLVEVPGAPPNGGQEEGSVWLKGSPEELAEALRTYADAGISHVQVWLEPFSLAGIETFGRTLEMLDRTA